MTRLPPSAGALPYADVALVRWMGVSSLSRNHQRDSLYRPVCEYPLSANHCLYEWSSLIGDRRCFQILSGMDDRLKWWKHMPPNQREQTMISETRAWYNVIEYSSIKQHVNVMVDPSTGHMLRVTNYSNDIRK